MSYNHKPVFKLLDEVAELRGKPKTTYKQLNPLLHKLELALKRLRYQTEDVTHQLRVLDSMFADDGKEPRLTAWESMEVTRKRTGRGGRRERMPRDDEELPEGES